VPLCRATLARNALGGRCRVVHADLRELPGPHLDGRADADALARGGYDLITGSPPFLPLAKAPPSAHTQKAHCRSEYRGSVVDYCAAAARLLKPRTGRFVFVMAAQDARAEAAPAAAGLAVLERFDFTFKEGRKPHICTMVCARAGGARGAHARAPPPERARHHMLLRDRDGERTAHYRAFQEYMQLPPGGASVERLRACIDALRAALRGAAPDAADGGADARALRAAVADARSAGLRPSRGSELQRALARLEERGAG
jgi:tRNA1Val (adenine37-N6)-methyltransferase